MHRSFGSSNVRRHSHTHSTSRAPSLSVRLTAAVLFALLGAPVLPLPLGASADEDVPRPLAPDEPSSSPPATEPGATADDPAPDEAARARYRALVDALADPSYTVRERSTRDLVAAGEPALPELRRGLDSQDPELRRRAQSIIDEISRLAAAKEEEPGPGRRLLDLPELADPAFDEAVRRLDEIFRRFDPAHTPGEALRRDRSFPGGELAEIERRLAELRAQFQRRFPRLPDLDRSTLLGGAEDAFSAIDGFGAGSSRIQIWRDGQKVFDSSRDASFAEAPALGVVVESLHPSLRAHLPIPEGQGVLVADIAPGSRAESAGLRVHDILLTVDGTPIADAISLRKLLREATAARIELGILREGSPSTLQIEFAARAR